MLLENKLSRNAANLINLLSLIEPIKSYESARHYLKTSSVLKWEISTMFLHTFLDIKKNNKKIGRTLTLTSDT